MPIEPTNADLFVQQENLRDDFRLHAKEDHDVAANQADVNKQVKDSLASLHEWKETVATKEDIRELKDFMGQVNVGLGIFRFSWNNAGKIGSFLLLIGGLFVFFKVGFAAAVAYIFGSHN